MTQEEQQLYWYNRIQVKTGSEKVKNIGRIGRSKTEQKFHDFTVESETENFKLIVEDKALFVNLRVLASLSGYFEKIYLGENFNEKQEMEAVIRDVDFDDFHEMLQYLDLESESPIAFENAGKMLELADRFEITGFVNEVAEAIGSENYLDELNDDDVIRLVVIIDRIQVESVAARKKLIERLSRVSYDHLKKSGIFTEISQNLSLALMRAVSTGNRCPFYKVYGSDQDGQIDIQELESANYYKKINDHIFSKKIVDVGGCDCGHGTLRYTCPQCPGSYPLYCTQCKRLSVKDSCLGGCMTLWCPLDLPPCANPTLISKLDAPEPKLDLDFLN